MSKRAGFGVPIYTLNTVENVKKSYESLQKSPEFFHISENYQGSNKITLYSLSFQLLLI